MARPTFTSVQGALRALDVTIFRTAEPGEFCVRLAAHRRSRDGAGYYTIDLTDALETGRAMAAERDRNARRAA